VRRLFKIASAVSLLLLVVTMALAIVSFDRSISYLILPPNTTIIRAAYLDEYSVGYFKNQNEYVDRASGRRIAGPSIPLAYTPGLNRGVPQATFTPNERHAFLGISWAESKAMSIDNASTSRIITIFKVDVSLWLLAVVLAILPAIWLLRFQFDRQQQRRREGRCLACGYDLAGNVSGVCPECGTAVAAHTATPK
jgi:hypothetical protein